MWESNEDAYLSLLARHVCVHIMVIFVTASCACMLVVIYANMLDVSMLVNSGRLLQVGMPLVLLSPEVTLWQLAGVGALL